MKLRTKIIKQPPYGNENASHCSCSKHKTEADALTSQSRPQQRPRRGLKTEQRDAAGAEKAVAAAGDSSGQAATAEDEAQVALLQLAELAGDEGEQEEQEAAGRQPQLKPLPAPIMCSVEEMSWLAAMRLSPLVDLCQLHPGLEAPGFGWPAGTTMPCLPSMPTTPAGLVQVLLGTPLSQHRTLPTPAFLDFGGPAVPPAKDHWHSHPPPPSRPVPTSTATATALPSRPVPTSTATALPSRPVPTSTATATALPGRALDPHTQLPSLVPIAVRQKHPLLLLPALLHSLPTYTPSSSGTATSGGAVAKAAAAPKLRVVLPGAIAAGKLPGATTAGAAAAPSAPAQHHRERAPSPDSQPRSQRARRQRVQSSEFHWSDEEEGEVEGGYDASMLPSADDEPPSSASSAASVTSSAKKLRATGQLQQQVQQGAVLRQVKALMHLAAPQAATAMGCSNTAFRKLCRSVGIQRWPSRRPQSSDSSR